MIARFRRAWCARIYGHIPYQYPGTRMICCARNCGWWTT
jgi:hypothetical protein